MFLKINNEYKHHVTFTKDDVLKFSDLTKDTNPLHLDEEFAAQSIFKNIIVPGFLSGAVFSKVFGTLFPGIGTIYLYQEMKFKKPVFVDKQHTAHFKVLEIISEKNRAKVYCSLNNPQGETCIEGYAIIMNKDKIL